MEIQLINKQIEPILHLDLEEKIYVYQLLWQSILKDMHLKESYLSEEQKNEIDRRLERIESGEAKFYDWEDVKREIKSSL